MYLIQKVDLNEDSLFLPFSPFGTFSQLEIYFEMIFEFQFSDYLGIKVENNGISVSFSYFTKLNALLHSL